MSLSVVEIAAAELGQNYIDGRAGGAKVSDDWLSSVHKGQAGRRGKDSNLRIPKQLPTELFGCLSGGHSRWLDIARGRMEHYSLGEANDFGHLGDGTEISRRLPGRVRALQSEFVISVSCGAHCTAAGGGGLPNIPSNLDIKFPSKRRLKKMAVCQDHARREILIS